VGKALMALTVQITKRLPEFELDVSLMAASEPVAILGPSGAGKSMLLGCIAGIERPDRGRISLGERALFDAEQHIQVPARERRVGMLFQGDSLFPHRTVAENIAFGLHGLPAEERARRMATWVERTHLRGLEHRRPRELSGGEQQRTALARALATEPEALLLDEPLSALDTHLRGQVETQLQETFAAFGRPALLVTHNIEEAYRLGHQLLVLSRGRVAALGPKEQIFRRPPTRAAAQLTGCKNLSQARMVADGQIEAADWSCKLGIAPESQGAAGRTPAFVGIRAHHLEFAGVDFDEASAVSSGSAARNIFPSWPVRVSETPFRVTLFLRLHEAPTDGAPHHLQAEVYKEKWRKFRDRPLPWRVRLAPEALFLMPE
jgi:molybdate transport system ATP-binding protein/molybdate transport system permease protein